MPNSRRKRHIADHFNDIEIMTCEVCATEGYKGTIRVFSATAERASEHLNICDECFEDFRSEMVLDESDTVFDRDVLSPKLYALLNDWAKKAAVLMFIEEYPITDHEETAMEFFEAVCKLLGNWNPNISFGTCKKNGESIFTSYEIHKLDALAENCKRVANGVDFARFFGLQKSNFIPKPLVTAGQTSITPLPWRIAPAKGSLARQWVIVGTLPDGTEHKLALIVDDLTGRARLNADHILKSANLFGEFTTALIGLLSFPPLQPGEPGYEADRYARQILNCAAPPEKRL